jgi:hypothetical protein
MPKRNIRDRVKTKLSDTPGIPTSRRPSPYIQYHTELQCVPPDPKPLLDGNVAFAKFPLPMPAFFPLHMIKGLEKYILVPGEHKGVKRFQLQKISSGKKLVPNVTGDRSMVCTINKRLVHFNAANVIASSILGIDVTGNGYGAIIVEEGVYVETCDDRRRLRDDEERNAEIKRLPRVDLRTIRRPIADDIDVRGRGYFVEGGTFYRKKDTPFTVDDEDGGACYPTGPLGKAVRVSLGWVLFSAYPKFYGFDVDVHKENDHIDGDRTNNAPNNFRPMTERQNKTVAVRKRKLGQ